MRIKRQSDDNAGQLSLTSMIDVVFLLLIFFVMTFKIAAQEGDFNVKMPLQGQGNSSAEPELPIKIRLKADAAGNIADIVVNDSQSFGNDFAKLRAFIVQMTPGGVDGPSEEKGPEVELDLDYGLKYEFVVSTITSVTGYKQGDDIVRLVERIKFAPPRKPAQ
jgi:biopolymer transport protein ExbD